MNGMIEMFGMKRMALASGMILIIAGQILSGAAAHPVPARMEFVSA